MLCQFKHHSPPHNFFSLKFVPIIIFITFNIISFSLPFTKFAVYIATILRPLMFVCALWDNRFQPPWFMSFQIGHLFVELQYCDFVFKNLELWGLSVIYVFMCAMNCECWEGNWLKDYGFTTFLLPSWRCACPSIWTMKLIERLYIAIFVFTLLHECTSVDLIECSFCFVNFVHVLLCNVDESSLCFHLNEE
jgi:hypothetical protein